MLRLMAVAAFFLVACTIVSKAEDDLDARIARIERENAQLKKMLRLRELEKENAALRARVDAVASPPQSRERNAASAPPSSAARTAAGHRAIENPEAAMALAKYTMPAKAVPPSVVPRPDRWSGAYVGGHVGGGFGNWSLVERYLSSHPYDACGGCTPAYVAGTSTSNASNTQPLHPLGFVAGAQAGYLWQLGHLAFGPEAEVGVANIKQAKAVLVTATTTCSPAPTPTGCGGSGTWQYSASASLDWLSTVRGRVGATYEDWFFYGSGGLAIAGVVANAPHTNVSSSSVAVGYTYGGGVSYAATDKLALRLDYQRVALPDKRLINESWLYWSTTTTTHELTLNPSVHVVKAGIDWKL